ncbi:FkbM family methyltransferase [Paenibacillus sp. NPDC056579]|uniref:FkbM family methyltransferase n=1 Tax=Paenibacillus sp. NPDC056579 TaxID=3345871 RepID=UPI0036A39CC6
MLISTSWNGRLLVPADDLSVMPELVFTGALELPLTSFIINEVKHGQTVVDMGANVGYFTVLLGLLVGPTGKVVAYEANPDIVPYLNDSLSINYLHDRTTVIPKAVYSCDTVVTFYANAKYKGNASIQKHPDVYFQHYKEDVVPVSVETEALDRYAGLFPTIDLLKIDIEGGEYHAFLGMKSFLDGRRIGTIVFELNGTALQDDEAPFFDLLRSYRDNVGYTFHLIDREGRLVPVSLEELAAAPGYPYVVMKPKP